MHNEFVVGQLYKFSIGLSDATDYWLAKTNPTIDVANDFAININDTGWVTLDNAPTVTPPGGEFVDVTFSVAETTAAGVGGYIKFRVADADEASGWIGGLARFAGVVAAPATTADVTTITGALTTVDTVVDGIAVQATAILDDTGTAGVVVAAASKTGYELSATGITAIWANATRTLTSFGTLAADVWAVAVRTITGGSLTVAPPTAAQIDTQLAGTHGAGSWATATGFATPTNVSDAQTAITNAIAALNNLSTSDLSTSLATYDGATGTELSATQTAITNAITALNNLSSAQAQSAAAAALAAYDPPTKAELDTAQTAIIAAIPGTTAIVDAIKAYAVETGVTFNDAMRIILAANGGNFLADDPNDPTEIIYYAPDGTTARLTFAVTTTTRTVV